MSSLSAHVSIFAVSFLAATILPGSSEVLLVALLLDRPSDSLTLFVVATIGNTLGSVVNWVLGRAFLHFADRRWFPVSQRQLDRVSTWFRRYGVWSLLLAWFPVAGDALTVIAGTLRVRILPFVALVATGKALRYLAIIWGQRPFKFCSTMSRKG
jgi:membrane protein YqaA with SNARE-associated domain